MCEQRWQIYSYKLWTCVRSVRNRAIIVSCKWAYRGTCEKWVCFKAPGVFMWSMTSLFWTVGTSTTGLMSTSYSNGQPQSWQAVNQRYYRRPLVQEYTIKSSNGLIKPATLQQTFWFCLLRAAQSLGWLKNQEAISLLCVIAWGLVLVINVQ